MSWSRLTLTLFFIFLTTPLPPVEAQTIPPATDASAHQVTLQVFAKGRGKPLGHVEVLVGTQSYFTAPDGSVELKLAALDGKKVLLRLSGYQQLFIPLADLLAAPLYKAYLLPGDPNDNEVFIYGKKRPEISKKTFSVEETGRIAPNGDPAQITKLMPGVISSPLSNDVVIRGSGPDDSRYYVDDLAVPMLFHQIGNFSVVPESMLQEVEFSSGGFGPQYGEATGGVIVLRTKSTVPEEAHTKLGLNVPFFVTSYHETPLSQESSLIVSLRHSISEFIIPPLIPKKAQTTLVPYFGDAHVRYLRLLDDGFYKVTALASDDGMKLATPYDISDNEDGRAHFDYRNRFATLGVERQKNLTKDLRVRTTPQLSVTDTNMDFLGMYVKGSTIQVGAPTEFTLRQGKEQYLYAGFSPFYYIGKFEALSVQPPSANDPFYDVQDAPRFTTSRTYTLSSQAAWLADDIVIGAATVTPGLRYFYNGLMQKGGTDPRVSLRWRLGDKDILKGAIGQYSISPTGPELSDDFGNTHLGFIHCYHYIAGWERTLSERWLIDLEAFFKRTIDVVESDPTVRYRNTGLMQSHGFELFLRRFLTEKSFGWISYTYSATKERSTEQSPWHMSPYDQTHEVNLAGSYRLTGTWDLGTRIKYNSGDVYTPVTGSTYSSGFDTYQPLYNESNPFSARYPADHSIDLFATYDALENTWKMTYRFGVEMLRLTRPKDHIEYNYDYSERKMTSFDLPAIPYFEIAGEF